MVCLVFLAGPKIALGYGGNGMQKSGRTADSNIRGIKLHAEQWRQ